MKQILLVDDEPAILRLLADALGEAGYATTACASSDEALKAARGKAVDAALVDLNLPGLDGIALMKSLRDLQPGLPVVVITGERAVDPAVNAMKAGAFDYFTKPLDLDRLGFAVRNAVEAAEKDREIQRLRAAANRAPGFDAIVSGSHAMKKAVELARRVAASEAGVLITGESGTGKELFARAIHGSSPRRDKPFVAVNCAAVPVTLAESEFLGHEPGSFTGAAGRRAGRFEEAHGGTIFLDEVEAMPIDIQAKILRVVQERSGVRVGGSKTFPADARVLAASNRDLEKMIAEGKFREDLFFRLAIVQVQVPPLRERPEDLPALAEILVQSAAQREGKAVRGLSPEAVAALARYRWPGNVRELQNVLMHAVIVCDEDTVKPAHLPARIMGGGDEGRPQTLEEAVSALERTLITDALRRSDGVQARAAELLGATKRVFNYKCAQYGLGKSGAPPPEPLPR